jgi:hypothetical protein
MKEGIKMSANLVIQNKIMELDQVYENILSQKRLAKQFGTKTEVANLSKEAEVVWVRIHALLSILDDIAAEEKVGA